MCRIGPADSVLLTVELPGGAQSTRRVILD